MSKPKNIMEDLMKKIILTLTLLSLIPLSSAFADKNHYRNYDYNNNRPIYTADRANHYNINRANQRIINPFAWNFWSYNYPRQNRFEYSRYQNRPLRHAYDRRRPSRFSYCRR